jgi:signal transduction histidine kinase
MAPFSRRLGRARSNAMVLAGLLVCTLALATLLAYEAQLAARSHRATAERALQDYAAVAAWELVAGVTDQMQAAIGGALAPVTRSRAASPFELLPAPNVLAPTSDSVLRCPSAAADQSRFYFRVDFRDGSVATSGASPSPAMQRWLVDTITAQVHALYQPDWNYAIALGGPTGERPLAFAYGVKFAEHSSAIAAFGIATCAEVVGPELFRRVIARRSLLPASVRGDARSDSLLSITVRDRAGRIVFQSEGVPRSPYAADAPLKQVGPLTVHAVIGARAVELLALGSIPATRVPWLVGLLVITAGMIAVTVMQLRREHQLARLRADFISSVSHELRTPLSQILLFAETLNLGRVRTDQERRAATGVIVQEGRRLMHLVENILHFSRAERQMTRLGPEPVDLSHAVAMVVEDWLPLAAAADVRVDAQYAADVHALADRGALRQMVLNLLDNAVKYGPAGQTVSVGTSTSGARARLWIDDQGAGIPVRERERVFESFYRLDAHANSAVAGSGIGLYVVRELARLHGGDAWVERAPSGGARVVVELPAAAPAPGFTDEHASLGEAPHSESAGPRA